MSYANHTGPRRHAGALGDGPPGVFRVQPVPAGEEVALRFRAAGVTNSNKGPVLEAIRVAVLETRHFKAPKRLDWGPGGTLSYLGETTSGNYTLPQIADFMVGVARKASQLSGKQVTASNVKHQDWEISPTGGGTSSAVGSAKVAQRAIKAKLDGLRGRVSNIFGVREYPKYEPSALRAVLNPSSFQTANPIVQFNVVRSLCIWGVVTATKRLAESEVMVAGVEKGVPNALRDALLQQADIESGLGMMETVVSSIESAMRTAGIGAYHVVVIAAAVVAGIAVLGALLYRLLDWMLSETPTQRAEEFCRAQFETTGERCTPQQLQAIMRGFVSDDEREEERSFWGQFSGAAGKGLGIAIAIIAVAAGSWLAWQAYTAHKTGSVARRLTGSSA